MYKVLRIINKFDTNLTKFKIFLLHAYFIFYKIFFFFAMLMSWTIIIYIRLPL